MLQPGGVSERKLLAREDILIGTQPDHRVARAHLEAEELSRLSRERLVNEPWGYGEVSLETENYVVLRVFIRKGEETSLHEHVKRDERFIVVRGSSFLIRSGVKIPIRE